jgi:hypothetical protein
VLAAVGLARKMAPIEPKMPIAKQAVLRAVPLWCGCISLERQHVLRQEVARYRRRRSRLHCVYPMEYEKRPLNSLR